MLFTKWNWRFVKGFAALSVTGCLTLNAFAGPYKGGDKDPGYSYHGGAPIGEEYPAPAPPAVSGAPAVEAAPTPAPATPPQAGDAPAPPDASEAPAAPEAPADLAPPTPDVDAPADFDAPDVDTLSADTGAASAPASAAPNMIGDYLNNLLQLSSGLTTHAVPIAGGGRMYKVAENTNPLPQDRVFFNFNHFDDALYSGAPGESYHDVEQYTFGYEKTFFGGLASAEVRVPFASGLDSNQTVVGAEGTEFGDIAFNLKSIVRQTNNSIVSAGLGITVPTAQDVEFAGTTVRHEAVHLLPYVGWAWREPCCGQWFSTAFAQLDFDVNGDTILNGVTEVGDFQEQTLLYLDWAVGYIAYESCCGYVNRISPTLELHYTTTLEDTDVVNGIVNPLNRVDVLNLTCGVHFNLNCCSTVTCAYITNLEADNNDVLDYPESEFAILLNRFF